MLFESKNLRITSEYGTATLWLGFPGEAANALDRDRLRELDEAISTVARSPSVRVLVIRSTSPNGFCSGLRPDVQIGLSNPADRASFSWYGQEVFNRLAGLEAVTLALIDGPCLGAGLELALACDYRLCVARPTTRLGFPDRVAGFGGSARLRVLLGRRADPLVNMGQTLSGREAWKLKLVDLAFSERRSRIELRTFLDQLELRPVKPRRAAELVGLAAERRAFAAHIPQAKPGSVAFSPLNPLPPLPDVIGLLGDNIEAARLASEAALRGNTIVVSGDRALVFAGIDAALSRGFVTPLEAERARSRVRSSENLSEFRRAGLVFVAEGHDPFRLAATVLPRVVVCVIHSLQATYRDASNQPDRHSLDSFPYPRRVVRFAFSGGKQFSITPSQSVDSDATLAVTAWMDSFFGHLGMESR
jgi:enoyl-CoA hydratase